MSKKVNQVDVDWNKAASQVVQQSSKDAAQELLTRKNAGADHAGKEQRSEYTGEQGTNRKRHKERKAAETGQAIHDLSAHISTGQAIRQINPKNGNRGLTLDR